MQLLYSKCVRTSSTGRRVAWSIFITVRDCWVRVKRGGWRVLESHQDGQYDVLEVVLQVHRVRAEQDEVALHQLGGGGGITQISDMGNTLFGRSAARRLFVRLFFCFKCPIHNITKGDLSDHIADLRPHSPSIAVSNGNALSLLGFFFFSCV